MEEILVISDNRHFIKKLYQYKLDIDNFSLNAIFYSGDIFEAYITYQPSIILIDNEIMLPIISIIEHFNAYRWSCKFIIVYKNMCPIYHFPNVYYCKLDKSQLLETIASTAKQNIYDYTIYSSTPSPHAPSESDLYYAMVCICTNPEAFHLEKNDISKIKNFLNSIGLVKTFNVFGNNIFLVMCKKSFKSLRNFLQIHSYICKYIHPSYAAIYDTELTLDQLNIRYQDLLSSSIFCSCFTSKLISYAEMQSLRKAKPDLDIYSIILNIITGSLLGKREMVENLIYQLYLVDIKLNLATESIFDMRRWTMFFEKTIFHIDCFQNVQLYIFKNTVEHEYHLALQYWNFVMTHFNKSSILPVNKDSLLVILNEFKNTDCSLEYISKKLGFTKSYVSRAFKTQFNITIVEFLQKLRIEYAYHLLENSQSSIKHIGLTVGYLDPQYFSRIFYKHTHFYPKEYRLLHKEKKSNESLY